MALNWIRGTDEHNQFVADQLKKILSNRNVQWRQMPTQENPYYLGSMSGPLKDHKLWWKGKGNRKLFAATVHVVDRLENVLKAKL